MIVAAQPFSDAIRAYLIQFVPLLTAMGGAGADRRIDLDAISSDVPYSLGAPHVVFTEIDTPRPRLLDGTHVPFTRTTWQFDVWAKAASERSAVAEALRAGLEAWRGTWAGHEIRPLGITIETDRATSENPSDESNDRDWRQMLRVSLWRRDRRDRISPNP